MIVDTFENGHSILKCFPYGDLKPQPFVEGSIENIKKTAQAVKKKFASTFPGIVQQLNAFLLILPKSDDANDYVKDHPLYIPFKKDPFNIDHGYATNRDESAASEKQANKDAEATAKDTRPDLEIWRSTPCMTKKAKIPFERVKSIVDENGTVNNIILKTCILTIIFYRRANIGTFLRE
jgi:hypothetical protein